MTGMPRAHSNNNPGNLDAGAPWQGLIARAKMTPEQAAETEMAVFQSPDWGFRALAIALCNLQRLHTCDTLRKLVQRFAAPAQNETGSYLRSVWTALRIGPDASIHLADSKLLGDLCRAIAVQESGDWFFLDVDLRAGVGMALARGIPERPMSEELTLLGRKN